MEQEPVRKKPGLLELLDKWEKQGASDAEIGEGIKTYFSRKARERGFPMRGTFELTPLCNLDCKMCYVHMTGEQLAARHQSVLSTERWKQIMSQAIDAGMIDALLTGGEAMLHPGFDELYLYLQSEGVEINVKSNGLLLTKERVNFFRKHVPQAIQISLYGSDDDSYELITGRRCYSAVIEGIQRVLDAGLELRVAITSSRYMLDNIEAMLELLHARGIEYIMASDLFEPRDETGRSTEALGLTLDEFIELKKVEARINGRKLVPVCAREVPASGSDQQMDQRGLRCGAGRESFAVSWKGKMSPCLMLNSICEDLQSVTFEDAWRKIHKAVLNYPIPRECLGCCYQSICPICVVQHAYGASIGHADPRFCERMRRMVSEGIVTKTRIMR